MTDQDLALKLFVVLSRAHTAVARHSEANIAEHGLSHGEFAILEVLYHKGPLLLGEVQRKILVSSGGVTYLVDRLEADGLVERRECETDRRARYAALTRKGQQLMKRIFPDHAAALEQSVAGLTKAEKEKAIDLLRKLGVTAAASTPGAAAPAASAGRRSSADARSSAGTQSSAGTRSSAGRRSSAGARSSAGTRSSADK